MRRHVAVELVRVIRQIAQVEERLAVVEAELAALRRTDVFGLKGQIEPVAASGRDLLAEMAAKIDEQISAARALLDAGRRLR